ncbi:unnamed protein product, partial [Strongylus vulgaris]
MAVKDLSEDYGGEDDVERDLLHYSYKDVLAPENYGKVQPMLSD